MQRLLELPKGMIEFNSKGGRREGTSFIYACEKGHIGVVSLLLEQPDGIIDITAKDNEGKNGFMKACESKSILSIFGLKYKT